MANSGAITPLVQSGTDAFSNLYDIKITFPSVLTAVVNPGFSNDGDAKIDSLVSSVRAIDFKPPELKGSTYKQEYKGISINRLKPSIEGEREFEFQYRIDANYDFHTLMLNWKHLYLDPSGEGNINFNAIYKNALTDGNVNLGQVEINAYTGITGNLNDFGANLGNTAIATGWSFYQVICLEAGVPGFKREGGDALIATAKCVFIKYREPGSVLNADIPVVSKIV